jgi:hypothetical protein
MTFFYAFRFLFNSTGLDHSNGRVANFVVRIKLCLGQTPKFLNEKLNDQFGPQKPVNSPGFGRHTDLNSWSGEIQDLSLTVNTLKRSFHYGARIARWSR